MKDIVYTITFFSDWHCGSGLSAGSKSDAMVKRNRNGLPVVPGKTIKGLLKDAASDLFEGDTDFDDFIEACFGTGTKAQKDAINYEFYYQNSSFTSGLTKYFMDNPKEKEKLFRFLPSISIDEKGIAKNKALRTTEVCIPVTVVGAISNIPEDYRAKMIECIQMVKRLGSNRNRGLGRCRFDLVEKQEGGLL